MSGGVVSADMVGRDQILSELVGLLADARAGRGRSALVLGEPGIGKSTLAEAVTAHAASTGFRVARGWCSAARMSPYWPWRRILDTAGAVLDTSADRDTLLASVVHGLETASRAQPLLVVVEDLHWADLPSLLLLRAVVDAVPVLAITLLLTSRDDPLEVPAQVRDRLADLPPGVRRLTLPPLDGPAVATLIGNVAGRNLPAAVVADVQARTGGNPFFVREVARLLTGPGRAGDMVVPSGVREVLERRLARLSQPCHRMLSAAAVVGETIGDAIDGALLAAVCGVDKMAVEGLLGEAVHARLAVHDPAAEQRYRFAHALVREVVVLGLPPGEQARLHGRVADVLEQARDGRGHADRLAHHWSRASGAPARAAAARWALQAAREAMAELGFEPAAAHFRRALAGPEVDRVAVLIELGEAQRLAGDLTGATDSYVAAATLAEQAGRAEDLARGALGIGGGVAGFEVAVADERQIELLRRADAALPAGDHPLRAAVRARLSLALGGLAPERERRLLAEEATTMAARTGDRPIEAAALAAYCDAVAGPDYVTQRRAAAQRMLVLAAGDRITTLLARRLLVVAHLEHGDLPAADAEIDAYHRAADAAGIPLYQWLPVVWRGMRALLAGDLRAAFRYADRAAELADRAGSGNGTLMVFTLRMHAHVTAGTAHEYADEVRRVATGFGPMPLIYHAQPALVLLAAGEPAEAESVLHRFLATPDADITRDAEWLEAHWALAVIATTLGSRDAAARLLDTLHPYERLWAVDGIGGAVFGTVGHQLGLLAAFLGRRREATGYLQTARDTYRTAGTPQLAAQLDATLADLGVTPAPAPQEGRFHRDGRVWQLGWQGHTSVVPDAKGMRDLAILLSRPNQPILAVDLVAAARGPSAAEAGGDLGPVLDATARQAYRKRLADLDAAINTALDTARADRLRTERDAIARELAGALGLGGRPRQAGDPVDRARKAVTMRIRAALGAIESADPALARHLRNALQTGRACTYRPDSEVIWRT